MPATRYGTSVWTEGELRGHVRERLRGELTTDVVVIGGGLAGCTTAAVFAQAGVGVVLVEADRIAGAATAGGPGVFDPGAGSRFLDLRERHGLRAARSMWQAERRASLDMQALIRRLRIRCHLERLHVVDVAFVAEEASRLEREHQALVDAGLESSWVVGQRVRKIAGVEARAALKRAEAGAANPVLLAQGLARHAERRRAKVFERTSATRIKFGRKSVEVTCDSGRIQAKAVVVATDTPQPGVRALQRHVRPVATTVAVVSELPPAIRRGLGASTAIVRDCTTPRRAWRTDSRQGLFVWQAGQDPVPERQRLQASIQRTGQLMYEFSLVHPDISGLQPARGWTSSSYRSLDGLVIAGPHRAFPHHLFAVGLGTDGLQAAYLAARLNLRHYMGTPDKEDELFGFIR